MQQDLSILSGQFEQSILQCSSRCAGKGEEDQDGDRKSESLDDKSKGGE